MKKQNPVFFVGCFLLTCMLAGPAFAYFAYNAEYGGSWYFSVGAGRTAPLTSNANNFVGTGAGWPDDHYIADDTHGSFMGNIGAGYTWFNYNDWFPVLSLGAQYTYTASAKISGVIDQYSLPEFENYSYSYQFRRGTLLGVGKADIVHLGCFLPYITGGIGVSFNKTSNYIEQPLSNVTPRISPGFQSETNTYFSYMVGAGIDYTIYDYLWLSLEYNYGNFGYAKTGGGVATPTMTGFNYENEHLKNKLTANNFLISITYLINSV